MSRDLGGMVTKVNASMTSTGRRTWVARVDAGVHAVFLIVAAIVILQSGVLIDIWESFGY
jgi:hypothetical protein